LLLRGGSTETPRLWNRMRRNWRKLESTHAPKVEETFVTAMSSFCHPPVVYELPLKTCRFYTKTRAQNRARHRARGRREGNREETSRGEESHEGRREETSGEEESHEESHEETAKAP